MSVPSHGERHATSLRPKRSRVLFGLLFACFLVVMPACASPSNSTVFAVWVGDRYWGVMQWSGLGSESAPYTFVYLALGPGRTIGLFRCRRPLPEVRPRDVAAWLPLIISLAALCWVCAPRSRRREAATMTDTGSSPASMDGGEGGEDG